MDFLALHGLSALDVLGKSSAEKFAIAFWRCMCFLALDLVSPDSFRRCMCLLALDVDSLALDLSVFFLALGPMLISGVGGTQGKNT